MRINGLKHVGVVLLITWAVGAIADGLTVEQYQKVRDDPRIRSYISGIGEGILYANESLELDKTTRLYCPPSNLALNVDNEYQMIDATLKSNPTLPKTTSIAAIIVEAMRKTFPCK